MAIELSRSNSYKTLKNKESLIILHRICAFIRKKLLKHLTKQLLPIILDYGDEEYLLAETAKTIQEAARQKDFVDQIQLQSDLDFSWDNLLIYCNMIHCLVNAITLRLANQKAITVVKKFLPSMRQTKSNNCCF